MLIKSGLNSKLWLEVELKKTSTIKNPGSSRSAIRNSKPMIWRERLFHQVSMQVRFLWIRGAGGGIDRRALAMVWRESAGSITSSISKCEAILMALPCSYAFLTICSNASLRLPGSSMAASS